MRHSGFRRSGARRQKAVEDSGGNGTVVVKNRCPLLEGFVGGHDEGTPFVALADDLEEKIGAVLIDGEVANLVQEEDVLATASCVDVRMFPVSQRREQFLVARNTAAVLGRALPVDRCPLVLGVP